MTKDSKLELTSSIEDWRIIRECYVKSFLRYPLYNYMVPDDPSKREEFLRAYLDANYEVTVGRGQAVVLGLWVAEHEDPITRNTVCPRNDEYQLVGGVILLFPSSTGKGWAIQNDEIYWKAYEKYKLAQISAEGMERVKRYEAWEFSTVTEKLLTAGLPMWNGLFCAMLPEYTSQGLASKMFDKGVQLFSGAWKKQLHHLSSQKISSPKLDNKSRWADRFKNQPKQSPLVTSSMKALTIDSSKVISTNHQSPPSSELSSSKPTQTSALRQTNDWHSLLTASKHPLKAPLVIGICHGERSAHFYKMNGFNELFQTEFEDDGVSFTVNVFFLDPLKKMIADHHKLQKMELRDKL